MSEKKLERRDFIKLAGLSSAMLTMGMTQPEVVAETSRGFIVTSPEEYGGFLVEKVSGKRFPYEVRPHILKSMSQKLTVFSRNGWDENREYSKRQLVDPKMPDTTLDHAFHEASWLVARTRGMYQWCPARRTSSGYKKGKAPIAPWTPEENQMSWEEASLAVRHAAMFYGASLAGIAQLNPAWLYNDVYVGSDGPDGKDTLPVIRNSDRFEKTDEAYYIPETMNRVIALAFEEDYYGIMNSPGKLASAATGNGYSRMAFTASTLAAFISKLGYNALPAGNDTGPSIPMAIDAGLGQLGRNGLLMTPKYGPRVRIAKVITDMPLVPNEPINFGVKEFCEACMLCATQCPSNSISKGPETWEGTSVSNNPGVKKWYVSPEGCFDYNGFSCSNCKRICPFSKPNNSWLHQLCRYAIEGRVGILNDLMVKMDQASGYGEHRPHGHFWKMEEIKTLSSREES